VQPLRQDTLSGSALPGAVPSPGHRPSHRSRREDDAQPSAATRPSRPASTASSERTTAFARSNRGSSTGHRSGTAMHRHSDRRGREHAVHRILKSDAYRRREAEPGRSGEVDARVRSSESLSFRRHDLLELLPEPEPVQRPLEQREGRRRGQRDPEPRLAHDHEALAHPGLEWGTLIEQRQHPGENPPHHLLERDRRPGVARGPVRSRLVHPEPRRLAAPLRGERHAQRPEHLHLRLHPARLGVDQLPVQVVDRRLERRRHRQWRGRRRQRAAAAGSGASAAWAGRDVRPRART